MGEMVRCGTLVVAAALAACSLDPSIDAGNGAESGAPSDGAFGDGALVIGCLDEECAEVIIEGRSLFRTRDAVWVLFTEPLLGGRLQVVATERDDLALCDLAERCEPPPDGASVGVTVYDEARSDEPPPGSYPVIDFAVSPELGMRAAVIRVCGPDARCVHAQWSSVGGSVELGYEDGFAVLRFDDVDLRPGFEGGGSGRLVGGLRAPLCVSDATCRRDP